MKKLELIDYFFHPKNVALIGMSRNLMGPSGMILSNILKGEYKGPLYLVNKSIEAGKKILGLPVKRKLEEIDSELDLAFVIVPSRSVPEVLEDCGKQNVKAVVIISSGFGESVDYDAEKLVLQDQIIRIARKNGFVFAGPNCNGVWSDAVSLNAIFGPRVHNLSGHISYVTRGGTAGVFAMIETRVRGIGVTKFLNLGDSAGLKIQDLIEYYGQDSETKVIGVYSEGGGGQDIIQIAKEVTKIKPVVVYKSGVTDAGRRAALSHVGAIAGEYSDKIFEGVVKQAGLIPADSIDELVDICTAFLITNIPKGRKIGILTPAGSLGVMATDAMVKYGGLNVAPLPPEIIAKINHMLPEYWSHNNPIDVTDSMNFTVFTRIVKMLLQHDNFDGLLLLLGDFGDTRGKYVDFGLLDANYEVMIQYIKENVRKMRRYIEKSEKPVFFLGEFGGNDELQKYLRTHKILVLPEFRRIARTFSALVEWYEHSKKVQLD
ncbi:MAG: CoA-binding protein [Candidatus Helarchaeota archaeon]|nr:CoA-binding protein [Candidatus Helarchaeota archaeon]